MIKMIMILSHLLLLTRHFYIKINFHLKKKWQNLCLLYQIENHKYNYYYLIASYFQQFEMYLSKLVF